MISIISTAIMFALPPISLGFNSGGNTPSETGKMLLDQVATASRWTADRRVDAAGRPVPAAVTRAGYPVEDASCKIYMTDQPAGDYIFTFYGPKILFNFIGRGAVVDRAADLADGRRRYHVVTRSGQGIMSLSVAAIDPADPPRDFALIPPGYDPDDHPTWKYDFIRRFKIAPGGIRLMTLCAANGATVATWADRVLPTDFLQTGPNGVALEFLCDLINDVDPPAAWICMPDTADDEYIAQAARLVKSRVKSRCIYILEHSNELWNTAFPQYARNVAASRTDNRFTAADDAARGAQRSARRTIEIRRIWRREFGEDADRVRSVFAGQATQTYWVRKGMESLSADARLEIDYLSCGPYLDLPAAADVDGATAETILAAMRSRLDGAIGKGIRDHAAVAKQYGIPLIAYEGGQSLIPNRGAKVVNADLKRALQDDPRLIALINDLFRVWSDAGGSTFYDFGPPASAWDNFGFWGKLPRSDAPGSAKWDNTLSYILKQGDCTLDGRVDFLDYLAAVRNVGLNRRAWWEDGDADGDGDVDAADLMTIATGGRLTDPQRSEIQNQMSIMGKRR